MIWKVSLVLDLFTPFLISNRPLYNEKLCKNI
jgi:hypothetical protein